MTYDTSPEKVLSRWMALDIGSKRIGVAISDFLKLTAKPLLTVKRQSLTQDVQTLIELATEHQVSRIVIGRPLNLHGTRTPILDLVERFTDALEQQTALEIDWADERLSTKEAELLMTAQGVKISHRKAKRDEYAAALILTWYLEERTGAF